MKLLVIFMKHWMKLLKCLKNSTFSNISPISLYSLWTIYYSFCNSNTLYKIQFTCCTSNLQYLQLPLLTTNLKSKMLLLYYEWCVFKISFDAYYATWLQVFSIIFPATLSNIFLCISIFLYVNLTFLSLSYCSEKFFKKYLQFYFTCMRFSSKITQ